MPQLPCMASVLYHALSLNDPLHPSRVDAMIETVLSTVDANRDYADFTGTTWRPLYFVRWHTRVIRLLIALSFFRLSVSRSGSLEDYGEAVGNSGARQRARHGTNRAHRAALPHVQCQSPLRTFLTLWWPHACFFTRLFLQSNEEVQYIIYALLNTVCPLPDIPEAAFALPVHRVAYQIGRPVVEESVGRVKCVNQ